MAPRCRQSGDRAVLSIHGRSVVLEMARCHIMAHAEPQEVPKEPKGQLTILLCSVPGQRGERGLSGEPEG